MRSTTNKRREGSLREAKPASRGGEDDDENDDALNHFRLHELNLTSY